MRLFTALVVVLGMASGRAAAQDLTPRAYVAMPVSSNAFILTYAFSDGELLFDPTVPITDATGRIHTPVITYFNTFGLFGRLASLTGSLPFAVGHFSGEVLGQDRAVTRKGVADISVRFAVNLIGTPALAAPVFVKTPPPRATLGASLKVIAPTGQYDPALLVNIGSNRWGFKPELGYSRNAGPLTLDMYAGVWFFTSNNDFYRTVPGAPPNIRSQDPIGAFEFHVSYDVRPRLWISADVNYWRGGEASLNGAENRETLQANSRFGLTGSVPLTRHQAIKVSYSDGFIVRIGGNYRILSTAWQYSWLGAPFARN